MKKKLEADLISIAHRILKLKNKSELIQLHLETQKLYEKLSVLLFVEENFAEVKPTIDYADIQEKLTAVIEKEDEVAPIKQTETPEVAQTSPEKEPHHEETPIATEPKEAPAEQPEVIEPATEAIREEEKEIPVAGPVKETPFEPSFQLTKQEEAPVATTEEPFIAKQEKKQATLEDLLGNIQPEPIFVRAEHAEKKETATATDPAQNQEIIGKVDVIPAAKIEQVIDPKPSSLNDLLSKSINIGLNDRIGFEKHLFAGSSEDLNRVLSQLSTFNTYQEAHDFIEDMVKPDYNNWEGKDDYSQRFMEIVEKRFS